MFSRIQQARQLSAKIWNFCIETSKDYYKETGKWINKTKLQKLTKHRWPLHSQTIQAVVHRYINARDSAREARAKGYDNKYPWHKKKWYPLMFGEDAITVEDNRLILSMGTWENKRQEPLIIKLNNLPEDDIVKVEFAGMTALF